MKIFIGKKENKEGYFEVEYKFYLSIPPNVIGKVDANTTKEISGVSGYGIGTDIKTIQSDLIKKYNEEQEKLNQETKFEFYGMIFDGNKWEVV